MTTGCINNLFLRGVEGSVRGGEYENKYVVRMVTALFNVEDVELRDLFSNGWRNPLVPVSVVWRSGTGACRRAVTMWALCVWGDMGS